MQQIKDGGLLEVVAGIVWRDGRLLAALRPEGKILGGYWEFPGGKMEAGESMEQALARELREELSIEAEEIAYWKSLRHEYPQGPVLLHFLHVNSFAGEARALEHKSLKWVYPQEALEMNFLPPDFPLLQELEDKSAQA